MFSSLGEEHAAGDTDEDGSHALKGRFSHFQAPTGLRSPNGVVPVPIELLPGLRPAACVLEERRQELLQQHRPVLRAQAFQGPWLEAGAPVGLLAEEALQERLPDLHLRKLPPAGIDGHLLGHSLQLLLTRADLAEPARAERAKGGSDPVEEPDLRLPIGAFAPRLPQERIDQRVRVHPAGDRLVGDEAGQVCIARAQRHVRRIVVGQDLRVGLGRGRSTAERFDEMEGVADLVPIAALGIAAVGPLLPGGGEEAAHVAGRLPRTALADDVRESPRVALAHDHHHLDARRQASQERLELPHRELLPPKGDRTALRIVTIAGTVVGHEDQQPVAGDDPLPRGLEPFPQGRLPSGMQGHAGPLGIDDPRLRPQAIAQARTLEQPEVGGRAVPRGQVCRGVFTISGEDVDALGRHPPDAQEVDHVLEVVKVAQVVGSRPIAAVDQKSVNLPGR